MRRKSFVRLLMSCAATTVLAGGAVDAAPRPVPPSPHMPVVYAFVDALLKAGRDHAPAGHVPLLPPELNRATLAPPDARRQSDPDRDGNLLRLLYTLSETSNKPTYRDAADAQLKFYLEHSGKLHVAPWDAAVPWDLLADGPASAAAAPRPRPWMLWERCFALSPEQSKWLVLGLDDKPFADMARKNPRAAGYAIRAFAVAWQQTGDEQFLGHLERRIGRLEETAPVAAGDELLSLAIDCGGASTVSRSRTGARVPAALASRLRRLAAAQDRAFCALPHDLGKRAGFALGAGTRAVTPLWSGRGEATSGSVAMMCVSRYENAGDVRYRELIHAAADAYADLPRDSADAAPMTFGHVISLQLAAWRSTGRPEYLDRANAYAALAVKTFWTPDNPLPRDRADSETYSNATGLDTLAVAFVELHLSVRHISVVRALPNTIDR